MGIKLYMPEPCTSKWSDMEGNESVRRCFGCQRNVYNLSVMTEAEIEDLFAHRQGRLCVRSERGQDGRILGQSAVSKTSAVLHRRTGIAGAALASLIGLFSPLAVRGASRTTSARQIEVTPESLTVSVSDESESPISKVKVIIASPSTGDGVTGETDEHGVFQARGLAPGVYDLTAINPVFPEYRPFHQSGLVLPSPEPVQVHLRIHFIGSVDVTVSSASPSSSNTFVGEIVPKRRNPIARFFSKVRHLF